MGQLPDVLDAVKEATTLYHFNTPTNNLNDEMDEAEMETNVQLLKRWRKMPTQMI